MFFGVGRGLFELPELDVGDLVGCLGEDEGEEESADDRDGEGGAMHCGGAEMMVTWGIHETEWIRGGVKLSEELT